VLFKRQRKTFLLKRSLTTPLRIETACFFVPWKYSYLLTYLQTSEYQFIKADFFPETTILTTSQQQIVVNLCCCEQNPGALPVVVAPGAVVVVAAVAE